LRKVLHYTTLCGFATIFQLVTTFTPSGVGFAHISFLLSSSSLYPKSAAGNTREGVWHATPFGLVRGQPKRKNQEIQRLLYFWFLARFRGRGVPCDFGGLIFRGKIGSSKFVELHQIRNNLGKFARNGVFFSFSGNFAAGLAKAKHPFGCCLRRFSGRGKKRRKLM
jgi:hypothetical protein